MQSASVSPVLIKLDHLVTTGLIEGKTRFTGKTARKKMVDGAIK